jgi:hypothetical protein
VRKHFSIIARQRQITAAARKASESDEGKQFPSPGRGHLVDHRPKVLEGLLIGRGEPIGLQHVHDGLQGFTSQSTGPGRRPQPRGAAAIGGHRRTPVHATIPHELGLAAFPKRTALVLALPTGRWFSTIAFHPAVWPKYENGPEVKVARARVGSLTHMKRNNPRTHQELVGFEPLHFTWQP